MKTKIYKDGEDKEVWTVDLAAWLEDGWLTTPASTSKSETKKTTTRKPADSD